MDLLRGYHKKVAPRTMYLQFTPIEVPKRFKNLSYQGESSTAEIYYNIAKISRPGLESASFACHTNAFPTELHERYYGWHKLLFVEHSCKLQSNFF